MDIHEIVRETTVTLQGWEGDATVEGALDQHDGELASLRERVDRLESVVEQLRGALNE